MPVVERLRVIAEADVAPLERGLAASARAVTAFENAVVRAGRELNARLQAPFQNFALAGIRSMGDVSAGLSLMGEEADRVRDGFEGLNRAGVRLADIGTRLTLALTLPLAAVGTASVLSATRMDSLERGLTAVAGSSSEAAAQMTRLADVARLPGLGFREAIQGSIRLQAAGFSAQEAEASLRAFGNALATVGAGKAELDAVTRALTQIIAKGKVSAEEINQIAENLPQVRVAMEAAFGTANTEAIQRMGLSARSFVAGLTTELGKLEQVSGGPANDFENFADAPFRAGAAIGERMLPAVTGVLDALAAFAERAGAASGRMLDFGIAVGSTLAGLPVGILLVGQLTTAFVGLNAVLAAFRGGVALTGLASILVPGGILAGGIAATAGGLFLLLRHLNNVEDAAEEAGSELREAIDLSAPGAAALAESWRAIDEQIDAAKTSTERFLEAQRELRDLPRQRTSGLGGLTAPQPQLFTPGAGPAGDQEIAFTERVTRAMRDAASATQDFTAFIQLGVFTTTELRREVEETERRIRSLSQQRALAGTQEDFDDFTEKLTEANRQLSVLQDALRRQEGNAVFDKMTRDGEELGLVLTDVQRKARAAFDALRDAGLPEKLDEKGQSFDDLAKRLDALTPASKGLKELPDDMDAVGDATNAVTRSLITQAGSFDIIADGADRALIGVLDLVSGTQQLLESLRAMRTAGGGAEAIAGAIGGAGLALGALFALFNQSADPAAQRVLEENTAQLTRLTAGIADLSGVLGSTSGGVFGDALDAVERIIAFRKDALPRESDIDIARLLGIDMDVLEDAARALGIELDGTRASFDALFRALQTDFLDQWLSDFGRQVGLIQTRLDVFDIDDPIRQLDMMRDVFLEFATLGGGLTGFTFEKMLAGLDLNTSEGRDEFQKLLIKMMNQLLAGNEDVLAQLGDITPDEFIDFVRRFEQLVDELDDAATTAADVLQGSINEIAGYKLRLDQLRFDVSDPVGSDVALFFEDLDLDPDDGLEEEVRDLRDEIRALREQLERGGSTGSPTAVVVVQAGESREAVYAKVRSVIGDNAQTNEFLRQLDAYLPVEV